MAIALLSSPTCLVHGQLHSIDAAGEVEQLAQSSRRTNSERFLGLPSGRNTRSAAANSLRRACRSVAEPGVARLVSSIDQEAVKVAAAGEAAASIEPAALGGGPLLYDSGPAFCRPAGGCFYAGADLLVWWTDGMNVPPLVTASSTGTPRDEIGVLGQPGTSVLFGDDKLNDNVRLGGRFTLGYWLQESCDVGVETSFTVLERESTSFQATSPNTPIFARPFRNITTGTPDAVQLAIPGELQGSVLVDASTEYQSFDLRARRAVASSCDAQVDFLIGYRYANLEDRLNVSDSITTLVDFPPPLPIVAMGTNLVGADRFHTTNRFHGGQLGFLYQTERCGLNVELLLNLALGSTSSEVMIDGTTTVSQPGAAVTTQPGSKLALPSNIGIYQRDTFAMIPELSLRLNYDVSSCWRASLAYTFVYWSHVARAGNQIDLDIDENQFPLPNVPAAPGIWPEFDFDFDDFWAQGISFAMTREF